MQAPPSRRWRRTLRSVPQSAASVRPPAPPAPAAKPRKRWTTARAAASAPRPPHRQTCRAIGRRHRLGPVNTISLVVLSFVDGTYGGTVLSHCELLATATGQCEPVEPAGTPILYVAEHGCKWRGLPRRFGNWHTIYTRMNRWSKNGVLDRVFEQLQRAQLVRIKLEAVSLDSTIVKVHPDGTGARKKTVPRLSASPEAMARFIGRGCSHRHSLPDKPMMRPRGASC